MFAPLSLHTSMHRIPPNLVSSRSQDTFPVSCQFSLFRFQSNALFRRQSYRGNWFYQCDPSFVRVQRVSLSCTLLNFLELETKLLSGHLQFVGGGTWDNLKQLQVKGRVELYNWKICSWSKASTNKWRMLSQNYVCAVGTKHQLDGSILFFSFHREFN